MARSRREFDARYVETWRHGYAMGSVERLELALRTVLAAPDVAAAASDLAAHLSRLHPEAYAELVRRLPADQRDTIARTGVQTIP
jgi:hypothetical protein